MLPAVEITKRLFILGICAIAVVPRQHIDHSLCSIGGGPISHSFRKLLLASALLNLFRLFCKLLGFHWTATILGIVQIISLTFLCFVTPYVLQTWLASRINLGGGRPGADLMTPLYLTAILSISGVALSHTMHPNFWALNRLGNVISGFPVMRTLRTYNSVTSLGGHHAGRGNILCQTLLVVEIWFMLTQFLCAIGYAFNNNNKPMAEYSAWDSVLQGFQDFAFTLPLLA